MNEYRVICNSEKEHSELKKIYGENIKDYTKRSDITYYNTFNGLIGSVSTWYIASELVENPEISPISFEEWKESYKKEQIEKQIGEKLNNLRLINNRWEYDK